MPAYLRFTGTGFFVGEGKIVTNRHVAEPWWKNQTAKLFVDAGLRPVPILFRAFFPGIEKPFTLRIGGISENADVAVLRFDSDGIELPVVSLQADSRSLSVGAPLWIIGYPAGFDSLLTRVDDTTLKNSIFGGENMHLDDVGMKLSQEGLVRPWMNWGHVSDVQPHVLTHDAPTTSGASGSPIFDLHGRVIGINRAIFPGFSGLNFAIPIERALGLIKQAT